MRPHLVTAQQWVEEELEADGSIARELDHARPLRALRVLGQEVALRSGAAGAPPEIIRSWSARAALKRTSDFVGAILLGIVFFPLMCAIAVMLRSEGGCVVYRHRRVGRDGRAFECLKFRSMVPDADRVLRELLESRPELKAEWLRGHKLRNDPRVTALGRFLRRTSLDELPQIWNVLRGEMSLVGPRPVVREELMRYGRCLPIYLSAKPGITGLWQVTGRNDTDYRRRVALDVYYVRKQNLLLDLYILIKTTRVVLGGGGAY
jgi:exopolysaccharide production protein ExoY